MLSPFLRLHHWLFACPYHYHSLFCAQGRANKPDIFSPLFTAIESGHYLYTPPSRSFTPCGIHFGRVVHSICCPWHRKLSSFG